MSLNSEDQLRVRWIDSVKGFGIIFVILGHCYTIDNVTNNIIYSFHMPLFFIVAGYLYNEQKYDSLSFKEVLFKKFKRYIIPYFIFGIINTLLQIIWKVRVLKETVELSDLTTYLYGLLYCYPKKNVMPNCSPIWFFMCLFWASLFFYLIIKHLKKYVFIISAVLVFISYLFSLIIKDYVIWSIPNALMAVFFMYIGYLIKKYNVFCKIDKLKPIHLVLILLSIASLGLVSAFINHDANLGMAANQYNILPFFLLSSVSLSFVLMYLIKRFFSNSFFSYLGMNTIYVIGYSYVLRDISIEIHYMIPILNQVEFNFFSEFSITSICMLILIFLINLIKKLKKI